MDAQIIAFPSPPQPTTDPVAPLPPWEDWYEQNLIPVIDLVEQMGSLAMETELAAFWDLARNLQATLNSWPIPAEEGTTP